MDSTQQTKAGGMDYSKACKILGYTTPKSLKANAQLAESLLKNLTNTAPLKYKVAAMTLIRAAQ